MERKVFLSNCTQQLLSLFKDAPEDFLVDGVTLYRRAESLLAQTVSDLDDEIENFKNAKTLQRFADDALAVQDACNSSGLVYALARMIPQLVSIQDLLLLDDHPVVILFADKLDDLCRCREKEVIETNKTIPELMEDFVSYMDDVCKERPGTDAKNTCPGVRQRVLQLCYLCDSRGLGRFSKAYDMCVMSKNGVLPSGMVTV